MPLTANKAGPLQRLSLRPMVWGLLAWAGLAGILFGFAQGMRAHSTPSILRLEGHLTPTEMLSDLSLPAGVAIRTVHVKTGDHVVTGSQLVSFDLQHLDAAISDLQQAEHMLAAQIACLSRNPMPPPTNADELATDTNAHSLPIPSTPEGAGATHTCERLQQQHKLALEKRLHQRAAIKARSTAVFQHFKRQSTKAKGIDQNAARLQASLTSVQLEASLKAFDLETAQVILDQQDERAALQVQLKAEVNDLNVDLTRFQTLRDQPVLTAPTPGRIHRIRRLPPGISYAEDTPIIQIATNDTLLSATATVPTNVASQLAVDDLVTIKLSGLPANFPALPGQVTDIRPTPGLLQVDGQSTVEIQFSPDNVADPNQRALIKQSLPTSGGAARAYITVEEQPISVEILRAFKQIFPHRFSNLARSPPLRGSITSG